MHQDKPACRNIGIDILKIAACLGVVIQHFGGTSGGGGGIVFSSLLHADCRVFEQ